MRNKQVLLPGVVVAGMLVFGIGLAAQAEETGGHAEIAGKADLTARAKDLKNTMVTPHWEQKLSSGTNVLWCSSFQLAWNALCELTGGTVQMESAPAMAAVLNKKAASGKDLDEDSYVAMAGLANEGIYERIRKELERKFKGKADPELLRASARMAWVTYAYLFKELPFRWRFTRLHEDLVFQGYCVDSFGIKQFLEIQKDEVKMASQVAVLYYKDNDNLIIELKTRAKEDRLILAKVPAQGSLAQTVDRVEKLMATGKPSKMREMEDLFVPVLDFDILCEFPE